MSVEPSAQEQEPELIRLKGEFDIARAAELRDLFSKLIGEGRSLIVDLGSTTFLDSTALGVLFTAHQRCEHRDLGFVVVVPEHTAHPVQNGVRLLGLARHAAVVQSLAQARAALGLSPAG